MDAVGSAARHAPVGHRSPTPLYVDDPEDDDSGTDYVKWQGSQTTCSALNQLIRSSTLSELRSADADEPTSRGAPLPFDHRLQLTWQPRRVAAPTVVRPDPGLLEIEHGGYAGARAIFFHLPPLVSEAAAAISRAPAVLDCCGAPSAPPWAREPGDVHGHA